MSHQSIEAIRSYIAELEIPEADASLATASRSDARTFTDSAPSAAVAGSSLVSFVGGLTGQQKSDVLNSTLLAQLAAKKKYDQYSQAMDWYRHYVDVLQNLGWNISNLNWQEGTVNRAIRLVDTTREVLRPICSTEEIGILEISFSALDNPTNTRQRELFDQQSMPGRQANFQTFPVSLDRGDPVMVLCATQMNTTEHKTRFFWITWEKSTVTKLAHSATKVVLNEGLYNEIRKDVTRKLGDNAHKFIEDLEI